MCPMGGKRQSQCKYYQWSDLIWRDLIYTSVTLSRVVVVVLRYWWQSSQYAATHSEGRLDRALIKL